MKNIYYLLKREGELYSSTYQRETDVKPHASEQCFKDYMDEEYFYDY